MPQLQRTDKFALIATLTVVVIRIAVWIGPYAGSTGYAYIGDFRWHHVHTGLVLCVITLVCMRLPKLALIVGGIGLGLVIDEPNEILSWLGAPVLPYWHWGTILLVILLLGILHSISLLRPKTAHSI
jgi:hypothetical protein